MDSNIQNVVIDTNVIVSAFLSSHDDVATVLVLNKLYKNEIRLYYSKEILAEYKDVLNREKFKSHKKFRFDKREINRFINYVLKKGIEIEPEKINEELIDKKDLPFYEIVMDKSIKESKLITGNIKYFPVKSFIMTPAEFIKTFGE